MLAHHIRDDIWSELSRSAKVWGNFARSKIAISEELLLDAKIGDGYQKISAKMLLFDESIKLDNESLKFSRVFSAADCRLYLHFLMIKLV